MEHEVMTMEEAAAFLRVDRKTLYEAVARRTVPHQRLGKRILFSKAALLAWLAAGPDGTGSPRAMPEGRGPMAEPPRVPPPPAPVLPQPWRRSPAEIEALKVKVMDAILAAPGLGAQQYAMHTGRTTYDIGPVLARLVAEGRLTKLGRGRAMTYRPRPT
jgi:excisionase family DNA binding protein